jgi:hypothetical protein
VYHPLQLAYYGFGTTSDGTLYLARFGSPLFPSEFSGNYTITIEIPSSACPKFGTAVPDLGALGIILFCNGLDNISSAMVRVNLQTKQVHVFANYKDGSQFLDAVTYSLS